MQIFLRKGSSFSDRGRLNFQAFKVRWKGNKNVQLVLQHCIITRLVQGCEQIYK